MLPITKILCPTDFSDPSYEALKTANELARHFSAELFLVNVVSTSPVIPGSPSLTGFHLPSIIKEMKDAAGKTLEEIAEERLDKEIKLRIMVVAGNPADEIARIASDEGIDLIVIATHGLSGWRKFIFGSVTEKVAKLSATPVLLIQHPLKQV